MAGDPRLKGLFQEMWELHLEKGEGYGTEEDTYANLRGAEWIGLPAWKMCLVRASDKWARIQNHLTKEVIPGDSLDNDLRACAMYILYAKILYEEELNNAIANKVDVAHETIVLSPAPVVAFGGAQADS